MREDEEEDPACHALAVFFPPHLFVCTHTVFWRLGTSTADEPRARACAPLGAVLPFVVLIFVEDGCNEQLN